MLKKLKAIGISFLITVGPPAILVGSCLMAGPIFVLVLDGQIFMPWSIFALFLCIPMGIVAFFATYMGQACMGVIYSNLAIFRVNGQIYQIDTNPSETASAKSAAIISLIMFFLSVPIATFVWFIRCIVILFNRNYTERVCKEAGASFHKLLKRLVICTICLALSSVNYGLLAIQEAKYSIEHYSFEFVDLSYGGKEFGVYQYTFKYTFQNNSNIQGRIFGDIILENKNSVKYVLKVTSECLSVYGSYGQFAEMDFEKHLVECNFRILDGETEINAMLKSDSADIRVSFVIYSAQWETWLGEQTRDYEEGQQILIKDFGV